MRASLGSAKGARRVCTVRGCRSNAGRRRDLRQQRFYPPGRADQELESLTRSGRGPGLRSVPGRQGGSAKHGGGSTYSAVPDAEAGRGQHGEESPLRVGLNVERSLGRTPWRAKQPLGPAAQEIHGPREGTDAGALAAPGPVCHTQRPRAGRPPPTPPPAETAVATAAARGICPLAWPGQADSMLRDEGTPALTGPKTGEGWGGRVGTQRGREERRGPPRPRPFLGPRGRHHAAPRGSAGKAAARARARALATSPLPLAGF